MSFKTEAIVLYHRPLKLADRLYYILTPTEGKLRVLLRSAGRSSSKLAGHLLPFSRVRLMIGRGKQDHLAGVDIITSNSAIHKDLQTTALASAIAELVMRINVAGQGAKLEYQLVNQALSLLADESLLAVDKLAVTRTFLWKLLAGTGWGPDFYRCSICGKVDNKGAIFYRSSKGFVCHQHQASALPINPELLKFLDMLLTTDDWSEILGAAKQKDLSQDWTILSQYYYQDILEQPLKSLELLKYI